MIKQAAALAAATLLANLASAHAGHAAAPLHLHDAEMLGLAALAAVATASVGGALRLWFSRRH